MKQTLSPNVVAINTPRPQIVPTKKAKNNKVPAVLATWVTKERVFRNWVERDDLNERRLAQMFEVRRDEIERINREKVRELLKMNGGMAA